MAHLRQGIKSKYARNKNAKLKVKSIKYYYRKITPTDEVKYSYKKKVIASKNKKFSYKA